MADVMTSVLRRARSYLVSVVLVYTVLVTFFLARTAWYGDVTDTRSTKEKDVKFLNVLVREERRHLQNVHDVVRNFNEG